MQKLTQVVQDIANKVSHSGQQNTHDFDISEGEDSQSSGDKLLEVDPANDSCSGKKGLSIELDSEVCNRKLKKL